ncbi:hypothetical protein [Saccharopolyspora sp. ASAGF58]|uniref:WXG100-like domain-containing protein n=1 Tax=Saccharopolyspora sp. ASAGF58 TaxID=2719023 RepID=UPI001446265C|nr:hypothetical protein [Saccharopolyspora sp. ASAGF58]
MFSSIMVPEGVRRLFQVLTGEDMTDADEGVLFAVADALESGAAGLGEVRALVAELVGKVRTEFSGKAADRFADGLGIFDGLLSSGQAGLLDLAAFVRKTSQQVRYLKLVTIYSLQLLWIEMAWAMQFAGATAGASLLWLAARMAVTRFLLTSWWRQLFMRLAMMAAGGVVFNVLPDVQAQLQMWGEESAEKWDRTLTEQAAGMGAFSALVALPMSAVGGLVSNTLTKVLVKGLGDDVDAAILEAAVKKAVAEHAELYPVSAMAKFADAVGKSLDDYAGMSVGTMWWARFGHSVGEALENALSEFFGEAGYLAATGQEVTWNPFSLTAGLFETVFSGVGNLAGLALRGKLHPEGPSPYLEGTGGGGGGSDDGGGSGGEKTPLPGAGSGSQTGDIPGSPDKDSTFIPSDASRSDASRSDRWTGSDFSSVSDVDSVFSDTGSVDSAAVSVSSGDGVVVRGSAVVSAVVVGGTDGKDGKDGTDGTDGKRGADGGVPGGTPARDVPVVPGAGQHRPGTPPPAYSGGVPGVDPDRPGTPLPAHFGGVPGVGPDRPGTPPPPYSPGPGGDQAVPGKRPLEVSASKTPDPPTVTPHTSDVPADPPRPETGRPGSVVGSGGGVPAGHLVSEAVGSGSVVDSDGRVAGGHPGSPGGVTGLDGDPGVDSVAGHGDSHSHRQDGLVVSADSVRLPGEGSQAASSLHRDPVAVSPAGLPVDTVRVPVPAEVVAGGGLAKSVQGAAGSTGGPVLLVSDSNPNAGVVVPSDQGSALAQEMGRHVVAMMPGQAGREPRWTVFPADGSRPKPLAGPGAAVLTGGRSGGLAGLAEASVGVPAALGTAPGAVPVGQWSDADVLEEIKRVRLLGLSSEEKDAVRLIVQRMHDPRKLAGWSAVVSPADPVSVDDVVTLVAARRCELRGDRGQVEAFSRELAERLGTVLAEGSSGLSIRAGAGPVGQAGRSGESEAGWGSGRHTSGGPSQSDAAAAVDDPASGAAEQREPKGKKRTRGAADVGSRVSKRRKAATTVAAGSVSGNQGGEGDGSAPTHETAQDARIAERKRKRQEDNAKHFQAYKDDMARVAELKAKREKRRERGEELDSEEEKELAEGELKVEKRQQQWRKSSAKRAQAHKDRMARVAELTGKRERGEELDSEEEKVLAEGEPEMEKRQLQLRESRLTTNQKRKDDNARVAALQAKKKRKRERGEELDSEEEKELAERKQRVNKLQRQKREAYARYKKKARDEAARVAELENGEELWLLTPEEQDELDLRREIEMYTKEKKILEEQARERNRVTEEIKEFKALLQSAEIKDRLERLREQVLGLPDVAEPLKETTRKLAEKKKKLNGLGRIAGVGASGQQGEQDAMVLSGVSESAGAGREASPVGSDLGEWLAWANVDLGVSGDADSAEQSGAGRDAWSDGGVDREVRAAASSSVSDEDGQTGRRGAGEGWGEVEQELAGSVTRDGEPDLRVARLREWLEGAESRLASLEALPGWDEVLGKFSRELAERLGTNPAKGSSGLSIGPADQAGRSGESEAGWGSGRHTSGGTLQSGAAVPVDDMVGGSGDQRGPQEQAAPTEVDTDAQEAVREQIVPDGIARLTELVGRMERHLGTMPPEFDPNGVRRYVEALKQFVQQGSWNQEDLRTVDSRLGDWQRMERRLRNDRRAKVREVYAEAKQATEQGRDPIRYFPRGVPGGATSKEFADRQ